MNYLPPLISAMREVNRQSLVVSAGCATLWLISLPLLEPVVACLFLIPTVLAVLCCVLSAAMFYLLRGAHSLVSGLAEAWSEIADATDRRQCLMPVLAIGWRPTTHHDDDGIAWLAAILAISVVCWVLAFGAWGIIRWPTKNKRRRRKK